MLNKVQLIGRVGRDPEVRQIADGNIIAKFSLATFTRHRDKQTGELVKNTEWHTIVTFQNLAKIVDEFIKKGDLLYVEGKIQTRKYEKNGVNHYITDIVASDIKTLDKNSFLFQNNSDDTSSYQDDFDEVPF